MAYFEYDITKGFLKLEFISPLSKNRVSTQLLAIPQARLDADTHADSQNLATYTVSIEEGENYEVVLSSGIMGGDGQISDIDEEALIGVYEYDREDEDEETTSQLPPIDIVSFNELRSVADLYRMVSTNQIKLRPTFQRNAVWSSKEMSIFIDSLLKQLPIPSICISWDSNQQERMVIDGLQRLTAIVRFFEDDKWVIDNTDVIDSRIRGVKAKDIRDEKEGAIISNVTLPINVIRCDFTKSEHIDFIYCIFQRLNTGGVRLNAQEIRNCIFNGPFNSMLYTIAKTKAWEDFVGERKAKTNVRMANEEMILRFFAFKEKRNQYNGRLTTFLNDYMKSVRNQTQAELNEKKHTILSVLNFINQHFPEQTRVRNRQTIQECLLIGISENIDFLSTLRADDINVRYNAFTRLDCLQYDHMKEGLMKRDKVEERFNSSIRVFSSDYQNG